MLIRHSTLPEKPPAALPIVRRFLLFIRARYPAPISLPCYHSPPDIPVLLFPHILLLVFHFGCDNLRQWLPTDLLGDNRGETTEEVSFAVNNDRLGGEGHLEGPFLSG